MQAQHEKEEKYMAVLLEIAKVFANLPDLDKEESICSL